jgi:hypothetical protein
MHKWILHAAATTRKNEAKQGGESCLAWGSRAWWGGSTSDSKGIGWGDGGRSQLWEEKEKVVEERERLEGEEREPWWLLGGRLVVALVGSWNGGERERERRNCRNQGWRGWFLADFGPDFLIPQTLTSTSIYRRGKRANLSTLRKNFSPWFSWEGSQLLVQNRHGALSNLQL